jgi:hypothetical protein
MNTAAKTAQVQLDRASATRWRVMLDPENQLGLYSGPLGTRHER